MKKYDDNLFKIGEIAKILGVTRKTILVYEDMGLLTPAIKDEKSGYRYYTADKYDTDPLLNVYKMCSESDTDSKKRMTGSYLSCVSCYLLFFVILQNHSLMLA